MPPLSYHSPHLAIRGFQNCWYQGCPICIKKEVCSKIPRRRREKTIFLWNGGWVGWWCNMHGNLFLHSCNPLKASSRWLKWIATTVRKCFHKCNIRQVLGCWDWGTVRIHKHINAIDNGTFCRSQKVWTLNSNPLKISNLSLLVSLSFGSR